MGDPTNKGIDEAVARLKATVTKEVEQHADEDVSIEDLEDVSGGWKIVYETDPKPTQPVDTFNPGTLT